MQMFLFWKVMVTVFIAEMGDKTQLMLIAMTDKFKVRDIILGTAAAILVLNGIAVLAGGLVGSLIPGWQIKLTAAAAFLYFAATSLGEDEEEEEEGAAKGKFGFAPLAVFCTFFIAELGDKTQLAAITFGASEGLAAALVVWLACSVGLFAADILGMMVGYLLQSKMPEGFLHWLAFLLFSIFGITTLRTGLVMLLGVGNALIIPILGFVAGAFAVICFLRLRKGKQD